MFNINNKKDKACGRIAKGLCPIRTNIIGIALVIILFLIPMTSNALDFTPRSETSLKISANGGFFTPIRSNMGKLYGTSLTAGGSIEYRISSKFYLGVFGGYIKLDKGDLYIKYRNIYFGPMASYLIREGVRHSIYGQLGIGFNVRKIHAYSEAYIQKDMGPSLNLALGADYIIVGPVFIGGKVAFDYIYDSNPDQGDFGNTGGFNFLINLGAEF